MNSRIVTIDSLRGFAILIMVLANSTPYIFNEINIPVYLRVMFSFAAPIFIFLSGYNYALSYSIKKTIQWKRSIQILMIAIIIDFIFWKINPFQTFDILYLISTCLMFWNVLFTFIQKPEKWIILILMLTLILTTLPIKYNFALPDNTNYSIMNSTKRWLWDGWFPIIPWISISGFGILFFIFKQKIEKHIKWILLICCVSSFIFIYNISNTNDWLNNSREGYLEIFYPFNKNILLFVLSIILFLPAILKKSISIPLLTLTGKSSLFFYFIHILIISLFINPFFLDKKINFSITNYSIFILCWIIFLLLLNLLIEKLKQLKGKPITNFIYFFIGL